jgi:methylmalonyl-CoA/ethylmalonyl-CoA epimerase
MTDTIALNKIGQIAVVVKDLDRAVAFYRDTLGMTFLFQAPPGLAFFDCGGVRLMLDRGEPGGEKFGTSIIYYKVTDIEGTAKKLRAKGVSFDEEPHRIAEMPDHDLWMAGLRDSEGNLLCLMEEKPLKH